MRTLL
jgi:hypothetical protein